MAEWFGKLFYKTDTYEKDLNYIQLDVAYLCINSQRHDEIEPIMYATAQRLGSLSSSDELGLTSLFCEKKQRMIERKKNRICMKLWIISLPLSRQPVSLPSLPLFECEKRLPETNVLLYERGSAKDLTKSREMTDSIHFRPLKMWANSWFLSQGLAYSTVIKDGLTFLSSLQQLWDQWKN